ncbi:MAG: hypothetical protein GY803_29760 [Chloroflexi bacterium]|nr:hypothetical protein [Chloroflexota bacterium]
MLHQVLHEISQVNGPVMLTDLSRKLDIAPSALQGMIDFWVRKGRLKDDDAETKAAMTCGSGCGSACMGMSSCSFIAKMPKTYSVPLRDIH